MALRLLGRVPSPKLFLKSYPLSTTRLMETRDGTGILFDMP
jgi:hypothetical protein